MELHVEGELPSFGGATGWLNSEPLTAEGLRGNVVLVQFWTYSCINWLRTLPYVRAWTDTYAPHGLVTIGVHTPEFEFEKDVDNIRRAADEMKIDYPIAIDSDYGVWRAFENHYWPALYFADTEGRLRHHHFGEGEYERSEQVIRRLLAEAGTGGSDSSVVSVVPDGAEVAADWADLQSPETYLGSDRAENRASSPERLRLNQWALTGDWTVERQTALLNKAGGQIAFRFHARDLNLVLGPSASGTPVRFRVLVDGEPPGSAHGGDVDDEGNGTVVEPRMYQLIRQPGRIADRTFEITFLEPGAQGYVFTFG